MLPALAAFLSLSIPRALTLPPEFSDCIERERSFYCARAFLSASLSIRALILFTSSPGPRLGLAVFVVAGHSGFPLLRRALIGIVLVSGTCLLGLRLRVSGTCLLGLRLRLHSRQPSRLVLVQLSLAVLAQDALAPCPISLLQQSRTRRRPLVFECFSLLQHAFDTPGDVVQSREHRSLITVSSATSNTSRLCGMHVNVRHTNVASLFVDDVDFAEFFTAW